MVSGRQVCLKCSHISASTFAFRLCHARVAAAFVDLVGVVKVGLVAAKALSSEIDAAVCVASLAAPARAVRRSHGNGAELGGRENADTAVIVATQSCERGSEACKRGVGALEKVVGLGIGADCK